MSQTPDRDKINPATLRPYADIQSKDFEQNKTGWRLGKDGCIELNEAMIQDATISPAKNIDEHVAFLDGNKLKLPVRGESGFPPPGSAIPGEAADAYSAWNGMGLGIEVATLAPGVEVEPGDLVTAAMVVTEENVRLPDHLIGPTPPDDERRFLAITQRKVDDIEQQIEALLNECKSYPGIDQRHLSIFRTHCEIGLAFAAKALMYVEIVDDTGKSR